jgi:DNA-binding PadR family transcriptional regulator
MFEILPFLYKKYTEVVVMIDVEIYDCGNFIIRNIGEELIKENKKNINFYFVNDFGLGERDYTILSEKNKNKYISRNCKMIVLTEEKCEEGIFLYQSKAKIKAEILKIIGCEEKRPKLEILAAISPYNLSAATIFNHYMAKELAKDGEKVCMLSFNIDFPFHYIGWNTGNKGLLKALYYYNNNENFNPGIINQCTGNQYHIIEMDIKEDEIHELTNVFINNLMKFLENQNYRYVVLDYGVLYRILKELENYLYYIQIEGGELDIEMDRKHIISINNIGKAEVIDLGQLDKNFSVKNGQIRFNNEREELIQWKRSLRMKLLKN